MAHGSSIAPASMEEHSGISTCVCDHPTSGAESSSRPDSGGTVETETPFVPSSYCQQQTGGRSKKDRTERALGGTACFVLGEVTRPSTVCRARHPLPPQPPARAALSACLAPRSGSAQRRRGLGAGASVRVVDCTATIARGADRTPAARLSPCPPRARTNGSSHPGLGPRRVAAPLVAELAPSLLTVLFSSVLARPQVNYWRGAVLLRRLTFQVYPTFTVSTRRLVLFFFFPKKGLKTWIWRLASWVG